MLLNQLRGRGYAVQPTATGCVMVTCVALLLVGCHSNSSEPSSDSSFGDMPALPERSEPTKGPALDEELVDQAARNLPGAKSYTEAGELLGDRPTAVVTPDPAFPGLAVLAACAADESTNRTLKLAITQGGKLIGEAAVDCADPQHPETAVATYQPQQFSAHGGNVNITIDPPIPARYSLRILGINN